MAKDSAKAISTYVGYSISNTQNSRQCLENSKHRPENLQNVGIIIVADKHEFTVKYATGGLTNKIFVSKYQLHLPDQKVLEKKVKEIIDGD